MIKFLQFVEKYFINRKLVLPDKIQPYERDFLGGKIT